MPEKIETYEQIRHASKNVDRNSRSEWMPLCSPIRCLENFSWRV